MPIVDDDCGSIVNCLSLKFMLMNFHIDLSIRSVCEWENINVCVSVCLAYWRSQSAMQPPQKNKEKSSLREKIKYNLISRYAKYSYIQSVYRMGSGGCGALPGFIEITLIN